MKEYSCLEGYLETKASLILFLNVITFSNFKKAAWDNRNSLELT